MSGTDCNPSHTWTVRRAVRTGVLMVVLWAVAIAAFLYRFQEVFLFHPIPVLPDTPSRLGLAHEEIELVAEDGTRLVGWWLPVDGAPGTILYCGGSIGNMGVRVGALRGLTDLGWNVLLFDYRSYGRSEGHPSEPGSKMDAAAAWAWLLDERGLRPEEIVVWGRSLGGAVAAWLTTRPGRAQPAGVILESTFTSVIEVGSERYPFLPVRTLSRLRFDSLARLPRLRAPLLLAHSPEDEIVGFHHAEALLAAAGSTRKRLLVMDGRHNRGHLTRPDYREEVLAFLDSVASASTSAQPAPYSPARTGR